MSLDNTEVDAFELTVKNKELTTEKKYNYYNVCLVYEDIISSMIKQIKTYLKNKHFSEIRIEIKSDLYMGEMSIDIIQKVNDIVNISEINFKMLNIDDEKHIYNILNGIYRDMINGKYKTNQKISTILHKLLLNRKLKEFCKISKVRGCNELSKTYKIVLKDE